MMRNQHEHYRFQGRNAKYDNLPVSQALSMGVHESQSLLWERMVFQVPYWQQILS
jgi:carboxypeptidase Taq